MASPEFHLDETLFFEAFECPKVTACEIHHVHKIPHSVTMIVISNSEKASESGSCRLVVNASD
jgi:hypothetical protein